MHQLDLSALFRTHACPFQEWMNSTRRSIMASEPSQTLPPRSGMISRRFWENSIPQHPFTNAWKLTCSKMRLESVSWPLPPSPAVSCSLLVLWVFSPSVVSLRQHYCSLYAQGYRVLSKFKIITIITTIIYCNNRVPEETVSIKKRGNQVQ